ncbi:hypothetical protein NRE35_004338 [Salmonella enterica]|nr:hypothetical protein [Salmonella enterica subsp. enterica serovar Oslo]EEX4841232.1 hypothetical protein [Escherichia coli]EJO2543972.1 hypothetical protein [Salmonella enterica]ELF5187193.1 hypothetical protein [Salmonella enterica]
MVDLTKDADQKHRAWWKIKNKRFLVQIPSYLIPRDDEYAAFGSFTTGSREADRIMAAAEERIWLPLIDLINIWIKGGAFTFLNPQKDIPVIHQILQDHISDFEVAEQKFNAGIYNEDEEVMNNRRRDMLELDEFAREIYKKAYHRDIPEDSPFKGLQRFLSPFEKIDLASAKSSRTPPPKYESVVNKVDYSALRNRRKY